MTETTCSISTPEQRKYVDIREAGLEFEPTGRVMKSRGPYRRHSTSFKLHLCQDIRNGAIGRRDAQRTYGVSANLIQLWLTQFVLWR